MVLSNHGMMRWRTLPRGVLDITALLDTTTKFSIAARNKHEENSSRYICGTLNLMMRQLGVSKEEKMQLNTDYPLSGATREMLGIAAGSPIRPYKDENTSVDSWRG